MLEEMKNIKEKLQKIIHYFPKTIQKIILSYYNYLGFKKSHIQRTLQLEFPIKKKDGSFLFYKPLFGNARNEGYFTQFYSEPEIPQVFLTIEDKLSIKTETLKGKLYSKNKKAKIMAKSDCVLPVSLIKKDFEGSYIDDNALVYLNINNKKTELMGLAINRYHYLPIKKNSKLEITSNYDFVVGNTLEKKQKKNHRKKLVLVLFVDGFAAEIFNNVEFKDIMPNTYNFFRKGIFFDNCYSSSNWTLPNLASMFSGKYTKNHGIFHPRKEIELGKNYPVVSNYFQDDGYLTLHVEGGWRLTPSYGYCKGFDRTVYKKNMQKSEVIDAFFEHVKAFKDRDNFVWLSFMDLHHDMNLIPDIDVQVETPIKLHNYQTRKIKSAVIKNFDEKKTHKYIKKLTGLDFTLKEVYDFIKSRYSEDEFLAMLVSDHGQGYIEDSKASLSKIRTHVPLMIVGSEKRSIRSKEMISNMNILPLLLHLSNINYDKSSLDGVLPKIFGGKGRNYTITETIYPGEQYTATITDKEDEFYFRTKNMVDNNGFVNIQGFKVNMANSKNGKDISHKKQKKLKEFTKIIIAHIGEN